MTATMYYAQAEGILGQSDMFRLTEEATPFGKQRVFASRPDSLYALLAQSQHFGERQYIFYQDAEREVRLTFAEHYAATISLATTLRDEYGIGTGDRVAILGANSPEWIVSFWATIALGATAVGLNGWWTGNEIEYATLHSGAKVLIGDEKRLARIEEKLDVPILSMADFDTHLSALTSGDAPQFSAPEVDEDSPALILYTSGTTGRPKGAIHSHKNVIHLLLSNFWHGARIGLAAALEAGIDPQTIEPPENRVFVTSPLFHVSGLHNAAITCLASGTASYWLGGRFDPERALRLISEHKLTSWGYTATLLKRLLQSPSLSQFDLSSLRVIGGGGSPIPPELQALARKHIPAAASTFGVGYGLTECTSLATLNPGAELAAFPNSVGRPIPVMDIEIRDDAGNCLPDGEPGEIYLQGPMIMSGYWNDPDATSSVLIDGWLRTGDWGYLQDGRLSIDARRSDLIIRGGENIYPAEIENVLEMHPLVEEAAVFGLPDQEFGQIVHAVVYAKDTIQEAELSEHCQAHLAYFKTPTSWKFESCPLPRNATGKILKSVLAGASGLTFIDE